MSADGHAAAVQHGLNGVGDLVHGHVITEFADLARRLAEQPARLGPSLEVADALRGTWDVVDFPDRLAQVFESGGGARDLGRVRALDFHVGDLLFGLHQQVAQRIDLGANARGPSGDVIERAILGHLAERAVEDLVELAVRAVQLFAELGRAVREPVDFLLQGFDVVGRDLGHDPSAGDLVRPFERVLGRFDGGFELLIVGEARHAPGAVEALVEQLAGVGLAQVDADRVRRGRRRVLGNVGIVLCGAAPGGFMAQ